MENMQNKVAVNITLLWVAIVMLVISNVVLFWMVTNPDKDITADSLHVQRIDIGSSMTLERRTIRMGYTNSFGSPRTTGITISANADPFIEIHGRDPSLRIEDWNDTKNELHSYGLVTTSPD